jgi:hypothetical protein
LTASRSSFSGFIKMAVSSAYKEVLHLAAAGGRGVRVPCYVAKSRRRCKGSMARMKSMGDRGSPWRTPLAWLKLGPCCPLSSTLEVVVQKRIDGHPFTPYWSNPSAWRTSSKKLQLIVSKALWMSSFIKRAGVFLLVQFPHCGLYI